MPDILSGLTNIIWSAEELKTVPRIGWMTEAGIKNPESVADHSFSVAVVSMVVADCYGLDSCKMVKMALLHDLCESLTGDIQPGDTTKLKKHQIERKALRAIVAKLPAKVRRTYLDLFDEYNAMKTKEAVIVHQLDKIEMAAQAIMYRRKGYKHLEALIQTAAHEASMPELKNLLGILMSE